MQARVGVRARTAAVIVVAMALTAWGPPAAAARVDGVWDDFHDGFIAGDPGARWFYFSAGGYVGDDGIATTDDGRLRVVSAGSNPRTGEPAFTRTLGPEHENGGVPGGVDHVKWLVYANHQSSAGVPGFDAPAGRELRCESWLGGRTFGTRFQPFGRAVSDPEGDLRLAAFAQNSIDFESFMVFDFFLTNREIYAFYERLPFGRTPAHRYAAFSYAIPVARNHPGELHHLVTAYDRSAGLERWLVDGHEVFRVSRVGRRLADRADMTLDHGGADEDVAPRQIDCGMGQFTLLDAYRPSNVGLVRLSDSAEFYFDPARGAPTPERFLDDQSLAANRLFGQGAELDVRRYRIFDAPPGQS